MSNRANRKSGNNRRQQAVKAAGRKPKNPNKVIKEKKS